MQGVEIACEVKHRLSRQQTVIGDAQLGFPAGRDAFHARFEFAGRAQQVATFGQQFASCRCEFRAMAAAVEQHYVEVFLEFLHGVGQCRRHTMQFVRGGGETALAVYGVNGQQCIKGQAHLDSLLK